MIYVRRGSISTIINNLWDPTVTRKLHEQLQSPVVYVLIIDITCRALGVLMRTRQTEDMTLLP